MATVSVRYIVDEVAAAIDFYAELGFGVDMNPAPQFAMLSRGDLHSRSMFPGQVGADILQRMGGFRNLAAGIEFGCSSMTSMRPSVACGLRAQCSGPT